MLLVSACRRTAFGRACRSMKPASVDARERGRLADGRFSVEFGAADAEPYLVALREVLDLVRIRQLAEEPAAKGPAA